MTVRALCCCLVVFCLPVAAHSEGAALPPAISKNAAALSGSIFANGRSLELLEHLTDECGPRLSGSDRYERAVSWAVDQFHAMGLKDVRLEPVTLRHGWKRGEASANLLGAQSKPLHVLAFGWSPPTPTSGLRARVVILPEPSDAAIEKAHVAGSIVIIDRSAFTGATAFQTSSPEDFERVRLYETVDRRLHDAGALALLVYSKTVNQVLRTSDPVAEGEALALPIGSIGHEDALFVLRQIQKGPVELDLHLDTTVSGPVVVNNVIAERRGSSKPEEVVMIGAHLDSWDLATGAQDNGSGVVQVLDAARAIVALPIAPRRTVRFALWASEEQGLNGSTAYVRAHGHEMKQIVAYFNTDTGAGRPLGWNVAGRPDTEHALAPLGVMLSRLGGNAITQDLEFDTDVASFLIAGVPTLDLSVVDDQYDSIVHHKPADTFDKVDDHELTAGAAMLAVTSYVLADADVRPAPRLSWDEVQSQLKKGGALQYVLGSRFRDLWKP